MGVVTETEDGKWIMEVPKPPPCLPPENSFDDLIARCAKLPYGYDFEALHGSHASYDWIAIVGQRKIGDGGHGNPGGLRNVFVGIGGLPRTALLDAVTQAERSLGEAPGG